MLTPEYDVKAHPIFSLPAHRLGPYEMRAVSVERSELGDARRKMENDWDHGIVRIDASLDDKSLLRFFLRHLLVAIHYRSGLNDKSNEESFTHSLASGLVELARSNPVFWVQFQKILSAQVRPCENWAATAAGVPPASAFAMPESITYRGKTCELTWVQSTKCEKARAYGFYLARKVELSNGLRGANLALVAIHEVIHFLHEREKLTDRSKEKDFVAGQVKMLLRFWKENPGFWHWWLNAARPIPFTGVQFEEASNEEDALDEEDALAYA